MESKIKVGEKPVKVGEKIWVEIISKGKNGDGIARFGKSNFIIFIANSEIGKEYKVQIVKVAKNVAFAEILREGKNG